MISTRQVLSHSPRVDQGTKQKGQGHDHNCQKLRTVDRDPVGSYEDRYGSHETLCLVHYVVFILLRRILSKGSSILLKLISVTRCPCDPLTGNMSIFHSPLTGHHNHCDREFPGLFPEVKCTFQTLETEECKVLHMYDPRVSLPLCPHPCHLRDFSVFGIRVCLPLPQVTLTGPLLRSRLFTCQVSHVHVLL